MGLRGPAPKPTWLKKISGTFRADRSAVNEPDPDLGEPPRPPGLSPMARRAWKQCARQLAAMRVLTVADGAALELLAEAYAEWHAASRTIRREGATYRAITKSGSVILPHPAVRQGADAWRRVQRMLSEFGLTPAARSRVSAVPGPKEGNKFHLIDSAAAAPRRRA